MNSYEERQEARKQRYKEKAQGLAHLSDELAAESSKMARSIPFGQPILIGHHSEKSDRSYRAKIGAKMDKAVAAQDKADYYEQKAESVGTGGISSYDPEAAEKIKEKIQRLKASNEHAKEINKLWRKTYNKIAKAQNVIKSSISDYATEEEKAAFFLAVDEFKKIDEAAAKVLAQKVTYDVYPSYSWMAPYRTDTAEIRRLEKRLKDLQIYNDMGLIEIEQNGYKFTQDPEEMRLMFEFDGKPSEEVRNILKGNGFKWSRYACAWVRKLTPSARMFAKMTRESLDKLTDEAVNK